MAWTAPTDRITGDVITAAQWNALLGATGDLSLTATGIVTTQGDTVYATAANTLARLAKGTAYQALAMNAGATAPSWQASPTSTLTTTGDLLYASAANTLARLGVGTAYQALAMNSGATLPTYQASPTSALTTTGDLLYASAANTLARLGIGSASQVLTVAGGVPTWATPSAGGWQFVASNTTEQTMTSATAADLVTISGFSIPTTSPVMIVVSFRGGPFGSPVVIGLKLNSTIVAEATSGGATGIGTATNDGLISAGVSIVTFGPRSTDYLSGGLAVSAYASSTTGITNYVRAGNPLTNFFPNAAITSIAIRGDSDGSVLLGVKDVYIYKGA